MANYYSIEMSMPTMSKVGARKDLFKLGRIIGKIEGLNYSDLEFTILGEEEIECLPDYEEFKFKIKIPSYDPDVVCDVISEMYKYGGIFLDNLYKEES